MRGLRVDDGFQTPQPVETIGLIPLSSLSAAKALFLFRQAQEVRLSDPDPDNELRGVVMVSLGRWPGGAATLIEAFAARDPALTSASGQQVTWRGSHVTAALAAGLHPRVIERALCLQMTRAEARLLIRGAKALASLSPELSQLRQRWSFPR